MPDSNKLLHNTLHPNNSRRGYSSSIKETDNKLTNSGTLSPVKTTPTKTAFGKFEIGYFHHSGESQYFVCHAIHSCVFGCWMAFLLSRYNKINEFEGNIYLRIILVNVAPFYGEIECVLYVPYPRVLD